jgi:hypothetical protein
VFPLSSSMERMQSLKGMFFGSPTGDASETVTFWYPGTSVTSPETTTISFELSFILGKKGSMHPEIRKNTKETGYGNFIFIYCGQKSGLTIVPPRARQSTHVI